MRLLFWLLAFVLVVYLGICALLFAYQRSMIYFPQPRAVQAAANTLRLPVPGADLVVTVRPAAGPRALVYFGGNGEDVSLNLPALSQAFPDHFLYLLHYRGYGGSTGNPTEDALRQDALALFDKVHAAQPEVTVIGRSLGSGVAVRLASQRPVQRLVLVTPYDSIQEIAAGQFPWIPVRWLMRDTYESVKYAAAIRVPTVLVAAERDEIIPAASTARLLAAFTPGVATLVILPGAGHNTISDLPPYWQALKGTP